MPLNCDVYSIIRISHLSRRIIKRKCREIWLDIFRRIQILLKKVWGGLTYPESGRQFRPLLKFSHQKTGNSSGHSNLGSETNSRSNKRIPAAVSYGAIQRNISKWSKMGFRGLTVQGSNGSYPYLSTSERVELVERVREIIDENRHQNIEVLKTTLGQD